MGISLRVTMGCQRVASSSVTDEDEREGVAMLQAMMALARGGSESEDGGEVQLDPSIAALRRGLAEFPSVGDVAYVLRRGDDGVLRAVPIEVDAETRFSFPFIKPSGSQSAQLGPVIKRGRNAEKEVSPGAKILASTLKSFADVAAVEGAPSPYRTALELLGDGHEARLSALVTALAAIPAKETCWVSLGNAPGNDPVYAGHLLGVLREERYKLAANATPSPCPLCGELRPLAPNGLKGAGINFGNLDNTGMFPGFDEARAGHRFACCGDCADQLRVFKNDVAESLKCLVGGESAIIIPEVTDPTTGRAASRAREIVALVQQGRGVDAAEDALLRVLARESSVASFHILWAELKQDLDDVTGLVTDVPRTRLAELSTLNAAANSWCAAAPRPGSMLPRSPVREALFDLALSLTRTVLYHPGGARVKRLNNGQQLKSFRRRISRAVYAGSSIDEGLWFLELRLVAASYLREALDLDERAAWWLLNEDQRASADAPRKASTRATAPTPERALRLTCAGWIRHAALLTRYLRTLEVIPPMSGEAYIPASERLRPFFVDSGVRGDAQAFAFLLGALWGKLVTIQAARKVNVKANALSWLRRGALAGDDLPRLFALTRMKLLEYEFFSDDSAAVIAELAALGLRLGDRIALDNDRTMYFLLLGQACATELMPAAPKKEPSQS